MVGSKPGAKFNRWRSAGRFFPRNVAKIMEKVIRSEGSQVAGSDLASLLYDTCVGRLTGVRLIFEAMDWKNFHAALSVGPARVKVRRPWLR